MLRLSIHGQGLPLLTEAAEVLGSEAKGRRAYRRALNEAGRDVTPPTYRALAKQTGLKPGVTRRALRAQKASMTSLSFELHGKGGDISLKYFGARETRAGVSAAPFGKRRVFAGRFMKGGKFPNRKVLKLGGHAFKPMWGERRWGRPFTREKSGVIIPNEMVVGTTSQTFRSVGESKLAEKVSRHIRLVTKGVLS